MVINSKSSGKFYHVVQAPDGYYAFVKMNGRYYATDRYKSLTNLKSFIF